MTAKIFIDGEVGTTGLQIRNRLEGRSDIQLLHLSEDRRKDRDARAEMLNAADLAILCLPDAAARDAVALITNPEVKVIDASTAHRVSDGWVYGFPELDSDQAGRIAGAQRVANPGCYGLASIAMLHPLIAAGVLPADTPVSLNAISGYSGGGRGMIESFEDPNAPDYTETPFRVYGLSLAHKHVPEIQTYSGLTKRPLFMPSVGRFARGMIVQLPLQLWSLPGTPTPGDLHAALSAHYAGRPFVQVADLAASQAMSGFEPEALNGTDVMALYVFANEVEGQAVVMARIDNLGKGAAGQAVHNLNLMCGFEETIGLEQGGLEQGLPVA